LKVVLESIGKHEHRQDAPEELALGWQLVGGTFSHRLLRIGRSRYGPA